MANMRQEVVEESCGLVSNVWEQGTVMVPEILPVVPLVLVAASSSRCTATATGRTFWVVIVEGAIETKGNLEDLALEQLGRGVKMALPYSI
jgi:hypothetical protein